MKTKDKGVLLPKNSHLNTNLSRKKPHLNKCQMMITLLVTVAPINVTSLAIGVIVVGGR